MRSCIHAGVYYTPQPLKAVCEMNMHEHASQFWTLAGRIRSRNSVRPEGSCEREHNKSQAPCRVVNHLALASIPDMCPDMCPLIDS